MTAETRDPTSDSNTITVTLPTPDSYVDGTPMWECPDGEIRAWPHGIDVDGSVEDDVDDLEATALAVLAAIRAHRALARAAS